MSRSTHLSPVSPVSSAGEGRRRSARLRLGMSLIAFALAGALVAGPAGSARAQESEGVPDDAKPLSIGKQATYTHNLGHTLPPSITNTFPPQALCLVFKQSCSEDAQENVTDREEFSLNDTVQENQPEDKTPVVAPSHMAQPGDLPASVLFGAKRHEAAIGFDLPTVPDGHQVDEFRVFFTQTDPTFHSDSPAFRQTFVAALQLAARQDPSEVPKLAERDPAAGSADDPSMFSGLEVCPITEAFSEGENQEGTEAPKDSTEADEPTLECGFGANGVPIEVDDETVVWAFDLTLAANAWIEGTLPDQGILIRPIGAPNLAHGDPDLSTSEQITLVGGDAEEGAPVFTFATSEKPEPVSLDLGSSAQVQGAQARTETFSEVLGNAGASPPTTQPARAAAPPPIEQVAPAVLTSDPVTEWWVWMLLPIFLAGAFLTTQGLLAEPAFAAERSGAMTRLIEARRAARGEA